MKALDTNVLVRFLVQDDKKQSNIVQALFSEAEKNKGSFYITLLVVLELIWVLEAVYQVSRQDVLHALAELLSMPILNFEKQSAIRRFILAASNSTFDLSDLLIAYSANDAGFDRTYTFDKKAAKFELFEKL